MAKITLEIPDAFIARFKACLPEKMAPLDGLKNVVKQFVLNKELNEYAEEQKRASVEQIRTEVKTRGEELNGELDF